MNIKFISDADLENVVGGTGPIDGGTTPARGQFLASVEVPAAPYVPIGDFANKQQQANAVKNALFLGIV